MSQLIRSHGWIDVRPEPLDVGPPDVGPLVAVGAGVPLPVVELVQAARPSSAAAANGRTVYRRFTGLLSTSGWTLAQTARLGPCSRGDGSVVDWCLSDWAMIASVSW